MPRALPLAFASSALLLASGCSTVREQLCDKLNQCVSEAPLPDPAPRAAGDECGASQVQPFVGYEADEGFRAYVAELTGTQEIRWIMPDTAVTLDFRPDRLNMRLDENTNVIEARCG